MLYRLASLAIGLLALGACAVRQPEPARVLVSPQGRYAERTIHDPIDGITTTAVEWNDLKAKLATVGNVHLSVRPVVMRLGEDASYYLAVDVSSDPWLRPWYGNSLTVVAGTARFDLEPLGIVGWTEWEKTRSVGARDWSHVKYQATAEILKVMANADSILVKLSGDGFVIGRFEESNLNVLREFVRRHVVESDSAMSRSQ